MTHAVESSTERGRRAGLAGETAATRSASPGSTGAAQAQLLGLQAAAGNAAVSRLVRDRPEPPPAGSGTHGTGNGPTAPSGSALERAVAHDRSGAARSPARVAGSPVLQREDSESADLPLAVKKAVAQINKNKITVSVPITAPPGVRVFKTLQLKKVSGSLSVSFQLTAPPTGAKSESSLSPAALTATKKQAALYAAELKGQLSSQPLGSMLKFTASSEAGTAYDPKDARNTASRSFNGTLNVKFGGGEAIPVEVSFNPLEYDPDKGKSGWSWPEVNLKVGSKEIVQKLDAKVSLGGSTLDTSVKITPSVTLTVGVEALSAAKELAKLYPDEAKQLVRAAAGEIAEREARIAESKLVDKLVAEEFLAFASNPKYAELLADPAAAEMLKRTTEQAITKAAAEQGVHDTLIRIANDEMAKLLDAPPSSVVSLYEIATVRKAVATELTVQAERAAFKASITKASEWAIVKAFKEFSLRKFAEKVALELAGGPVDLVLTGLEVLYNYIDTLFKSQELKTLELRTIAVRENYVTGYTQGMRGEAKGGAKGGKGNIEGQALMMGRYDGRSQFDAKVQSTAGADDFTKAEAEAAVREQVAGMPIATGAIITIASPKLQQMMLDAFEEMYSGGALRKLFGHDFKDTKEYKDFARIIGNVLGKGTQNRTYANLMENGQPTGVTVELIGLDSVGERTTRWRTVDGAYTVRFEVTDDRYSGWKTESGTPLEEIFQGDEAESTDDDAYQAAQKQKARGLTFYLRGQFPGTSLWAKSASTSADSGDLDLREFMRTADFQGMKLSEFAAVQITARQEWTAEFFDELSWDGWIIFTATISGGSGGLRILMQNGNEAAVGGGSDQWKSDTVATLAAWVASKSVAEVPLQI